MKKEVQPLSLTERLENRKKLRRRILALRRWSFAGVLVFLFALGAVYLASGLTWALNYHESPEAPGFYLFRRQNSMEKIAEKYGLDFQIPGVPGTERVRFTLTEDGWFSQIRLGLQDVDFPAGSEVCLSFASVPDGLGRTQHSRQIDLEVQNGTYVSTREVGIGTDRLTRYYLAYLEQHDLADVFERETGEKLSYAAARRALLAQDRVLYESGLVRTPEYPFWRRTWAAVQVWCFVAACLCLALFLGTLVFGRFFDLTGWTDENMTDWKESRSGMGEELDFRSLKKNRDTQARPELTKKQLRREKWDQFWRG